MYTVSFWTTLWLGSVIGAAVGVIIIGLLAGSKFDRIKGIVEELVCADERRRACVIERLVCEMGLNREGVG